LRTESRINAALRLSLGAGCGNSLDQPLHLNRPRRIEWRGRRRRTPGSTRKASNRNHVGRAIVVREQLRGPITERVSSRSNKTRGARNAMSSPARLRPGAMRAGRAHRQQDETEQDPKQCE
jgi:hypothetical protein